MDAQRSIRVIRVYYWLLSVLILYYGVITPLHKLIVRPRDFSITVIPLSIIPSCLFACVLVLAVRGLSSLSVWGYGLAITVQCIGLFFSLLAFTFNIAFGLAFGVLNGVILMILIQTSVEQEVLNAKNVSELIHTQRRRLLNRIIRVALTGLCLSLLGWCVIGEYTAQVMSGSRAMLRLAGITNAQLGRDEIRRALLEKTPLGTKEPAIIVFLEANGVPKDLFVGGQFVRYQTGNRYILALFSTPPWVTDFVCSQYHGGVRFIFDENEQLEDIIIENYSYCL